MQKRNIKLKIISIKKRNIKKSLKLTFIVTFSIITILLIYLIYQQIFVKETIEETTVINSYQCKGTIDYKVLLNPNVLYEAGYLPEGNIIITEYISEILPVFKFSFNADKEISMSGEYEIVAQVEGYSGSKETYTTIWQKDFVLLPLTEFDETNNKLEIAEEISLDLEKYSLFAKQVIKESKVNTSVKLNIFMNVNLVSNSNYGSIVENIKPSITIPLNAAYFKIDGNLLEEKSGDNTITTESVQLVNKKLVVIYSILLVIMILLIVMLIIYTRIIEEDPHKKLLNKIFKKYGNHLVSVTNNLSEYICDYYTVQSIEDLIRISEEVSKPVMYKYSPQFKNINKFYVFNEGISYIYNTDQYIDKHAIEENEIVNQSLVEAKDNTKDVADL